jgi:hypothetical protein
MNNWFDLDPAFGGHQPIYYDFWIQLYRRYCAIGAKLTVRFSNPNTYSVTAFICPVISETTVFTSPEQVIEHPYVKMVTLEPVTGKSSATLTFTLPFYKWHQLNVSSTGTLIGSLYDAVNNRYPTGTNIPAGFELFATYGAFRDSGASVSVVTVADLEVEGMFTDPYT